MNLAQMFGGGSGPQEDVLSGVALYGMLGSRLSAFAEAYIKATKDVSFTAEEKMRAGVAFATAFVFIDKITTGEAFKYILAGLTDSYTVDEMKLLGQAAQQASALNNKLFSEAAIDEKQARWEAFFAQLKNKGEDDEAAIAGLQD